MAIHSPKWWRHQGSPKTRFHLLPPPLRRNSSIAFLPLFSPAERKWKSTWRRPAEAIYLGIYIWKWSCSRQALDRHVIGSAAAAALQRFFYCRSWKYIYIDSTRALYIYIRAADGVKAQHTAYRAINGGARQSNYIDQRAHHFLFGGGH